MDRVPWNADDRKMNESKKSPRNAEERNGILDKYRKSQQRKRVDHKFYQPVYSNKYWILSFIKILGLI